MKCGQCQIFGDTGNYVVGFGQKALRTQAAIAVLRADLTSLAGG